MPPLPGVRRDAAPAAPCDAQREARRAGEGRDASREGQAVTFWAPWDPWMSPSADAATLLPRGSGGIVFVVIFCALVDFIKLLVELLGREQERRFTTDPSLVTAVIPSRNGAGRLPM